MNFRQETEAIFQLPARTRSNLSTCSKDQKLFQHRRNTLINSALESLEPNFESLGRTHSLHNTLINSSYMCCLYRSQSENHQNSSLLTWWLNLLDDATMERRERYAAISHFCFKLTRHLVNLSVSSSEPKVVVHQRFWHGFTSTDMRHCSSSSSCCCCSVPVHDYVKEEGGERTLVGRTKRPSWWKAGEKDTVKVHVSKQGLLAKTSMMMQEEEEEEAF